jgi:hypothetical protein
MMSERWGMLILVAVILCFAVTARAQEHPILDAKGFQLNRDYFSHFPFEHIDTQTGALILSFTDLVLPGHHGRDLKFRGPTTARTTAGPSA